MRRRLVFQLAAMTPALVAAQSATPRAWLQQRGGVDNRGVIDGTLTGQWAYKAPRPVRGLAVVDDLVVLGTESADADALPGKFASDQRGFVIALDARTGRPRWLRAVPSWIHGDPVYYQGTIVVSYGRWPMTHPGGVSAFDARTGGVRWQFAADAGVMPGPAVDSARRRVIVAGGDGILYALGLRDGRVLHASGMAAADAMSSPRMIAADQLYLGAAGTVSRYSLASLRATWSTRPAGLRDLGDIPVAVSDSFVFISGTSPVTLWSAARALPRPVFLGFLRTALRDRKWAAYDAWFRQQWLLGLRRVDGRVMWQQSLGIGLEVPRNTSGTPVLVTGDGGDRVVVSSPISRTITAFDASSGRTVWRTRVAATHKGAVTIIDGDVVFGDSRGDLGILRLSDGRRMGACKAGNAFTATAPLLVGRTLIVATKDGWLRAIPYDTIRARAIAHAARCS